MSWFDYKPYVSVAKRKAAAARKMEALKKKGRTITPIQVEGRAIARSFWGKAWCANLESYSDYENRLPRGRTYVRNGSVLDLQIIPGEIQALVNGSSIYEVDIKIAAVPEKKWLTLVRECAGKLGSLVELLQGKFSTHVMEIITRDHEGLFPSVREIQFSCSCPDYADMCKHVAATLYGVGSRLDTQPEALFVLRKADHLQLISKSTTTDMTQANTSNAKIVEGDLSALFGIDFEHGAPVHKKKFSTPKTKKPAKNVLKNSTSRKQAPPREKDSPALVKKKIPQKKSAKTKRTIKKTIPKPKSKPKVKATTKISKASQKNK